MGEKNSDVVIVGGGFGGLYAAQELGRRGVAATLIDKRNFHLFQPLLYQVATGFLSPGDIATPLRTILARYPNVNVLQDQVVDIDPSAKTAAMSSGTISYRKLIVAAGLTHSYFGHDDWAAQAPGIKSIEDAIEIRSRILAAFERAELSGGVEDLTFVIIGGGPTGVELAGAVAELARGTLKGEFRKFDPHSAKIVLFEGGDRLLSGFHPNISAYTAKTLASLGVEVRTGTRVTSIDRSKLMVHSAAGDETFFAGTIIWAAGVKATVTSSILAQKCGAELDRMGRLKVTPHLKIPGNEDIFVIGDLALCLGPNGSPLPGVAPVAMQQGKYAAAAAAAELQNETAAKPIKPFSYFDKGNMAVIGRGRAVAESWKFRLHGFPAWVAWAVVHIFFLIEFENKFMVFFQWAWNYITNKRGSRLISGENRAVDPLGRPH